MKIGQHRARSPFALAPMAGMTDTAFRRLVKRQGGCGLVVTEMVSSEGLVRGIDRTLEYAEYTEEERPVSIQIFGGDPEKMADAAQIVEGMGADIVDVNMGCPVPKIAKHNAGCSLMREPAHAATSSRAMAKAVKIPVTVKMRAGWNDREMQRAGAGEEGRGRRRGGGRGARPDGGAVVLRVVRLGPHRRASPSGVGIPGVRQRRLRRAGAGRRAAATARRVSGVLVGRGVLRNPWILAQAADLAARPPAARRSRCRSAASSCSTTSTCCCTRAWARPRASATSRRRRRGSRRATIAGARPRPLGDQQAARAGSWYTKGFDNGSHLRVAINSAESIPHLRAIIEDFFVAPGALSGQSVSSVTSAPSTSGSRTRVNARPTP